MADIFVLENGIRVICEKMDHYSSVAFGVWVDIGSGDENKNNNGIAHMIEHMMFKGTKNRTAVEIADRTAAIGGSLNAYTSKECTSYYVKTLPVHLDEAIDIIGDMLCNSLFLSEDLEKEKRVVKEEIDMYNDSPEDLVHEMLQKKIWNEHPLGFLISGEKKIVSGYQREDLLQFTQNYYTGENIVISVAGNFDVTETIDHIRTVFADIPAKGAEKSAELPIYHRCFYKKKKEIEQVHLNLSFDSITYTDPLRYAFTILNAVLGGDVNSRLFQEIREKHGLTYSIYSYGSSYRKAGLFHIYAAMNANQAEKVFQKICNIIRELRKHGITEQTLSAVKDQIKTEMILNSESTQRRMNGNAKSLINHGRIITLEETIQALEKVKMDEINYCLEHYLSLDNSSLALVGNLDGFSVGSLHDRWLNLG